MISNKINIIILIITILLLIGSLLIMYNEGNQEAHIKQTYDAWIKTNCIVINQTEDQAWMNQHALNTPTQ